MGKGTVLLMLVYGATARESRDTCSPSPRATEGTAMVQRTARMEKTNSNMETTHMEKTNRTMETKHQALRRRRFHSEPCSLTKTPKWGYDICVDGKICNYYSNQFCSLSKHCIQCKAAGCPNGCKFNCIGHDVPIGQSGQSRLLQPWVCADKPPPPRERRRRQISSPRRREIGRASCRERV